MRPLGTAMTMGVDTRVRLGGGLALGKFGVTAHRRSRVTRLSFDVARRQDRQIKEGRQ
jgi:hypothetical protein